MGFVPNGVARVPAEQRLNVFALVIYVPDPDASHPDYPDLILSSVKREL